MSDWLQLDVDGLRFAALQAGDPEAPLVLCLHGFPDTAHTWQALLPQLAAQGYYALAPALRGYPPSAAAPDGDYSVPRLGRDVLGLLDALGRHDAAVIGHDWGAVAGYCAANIAPARLRALVAAAVPHPRLLRPHPRQLRNSWYMARFQFPDAERRLAAKDWALVEQLWRDWSPGWRFTPADIAPVKAALAAEGPEAALAYYRALPRTLLRPPPGALRTVFARTRVPTRMVAGAQDGCMRAAGFAHGERAFSGPWDLITLDAAGHFMHREQPAAFAAAVTEWLGLHAPPARPDSSASIH